MAEELAPDLPPAVVVVLVGAWARLYGLVGFNDEIARRLVVSPGGSLHGGESAGWRGLEAVPFLR